MAFQTYEQFAKFSVTCWPSLNLDEHELFNHTFLTVGNGVEWKDGGLTHGYPSNEDRLRTAHREHPDLRVTQRREIKFREQSLGIAGNDYWFRAEDGRIGVKVYPICEDSPIMSIPSDVEESWLIAAHRTILWTRSPYARATAKDLTWLGRAAKRIHFLAKAKGFTRKIEEIAPFSPENPIPTFILAETMDQPRLSGGLIRRVLSWVRFRSSV